MPMLHLYVDMIDTLICRYGPSCILWFLNSSHLDCCFSQNLYRIFLEILNVLYMCMTHKRVLERPCI